MIRYEPAAGGCSTGPMPGTMALYAFVLNSPRFPSAVGLGVYNCRNVDDTNTLSLHGKGRAFDVGFPAGSAEGDALFEFLVANHVALGIQQVLWANKGWRLGRGRFRPSRKTRADHQTHVHGEQRSAPSLSLTDRIVAAIFGEPVPEPSMILRQGDRGGAVAELQRRLNQTGARLTVDGIFGPLTTQALITFQADTDIALRAENRGEWLQPDGIFGPMTNRYLPELSMTNDERWIVELYDKYLSRGASESEVEYWMTVLARLGTRTATERTFELATAVELRERQRHQAGPVAVRAAAAEALAELFLDGEGKR